MPIYEYQCQACGQVFSHFWRSIKAADEQSAPVCPQCESADTQRLVSQVTVLGSLGGLTPEEKKAENAYYEKLASITPKEQIEKFRAAKKKEKGS
ncbi:MAG: zinc ribbon domain-containing protein [Caldilineae bacterium]|nr:MAG: zinc ribbon domain-containing protein [Caldilineae bacterium]